MIVVIRQLVTAMVLMLTGERRIVLMLMVRPVLRDMAAHWMPYAVMLHHHLPGRLLRFTGAGASV
jgi:hypothetical protein